MSQIIRFGSGIIPPGTFIEQIDGDVGFVSGAVVSFNATPTAGSTIQFNGSGTTMLFEVTDGDGNTILGNGSGNGSITGNSNSGFGALVFTELTTGNDNVAVGGGALTILEDGDNNTGVGVGSLVDLVSGSNNTALGTNAGSNYTGSESSNILINNDGVIGDSHTLRIGSATGAAGAQELNKAFIHGIRGIPAATADQVLINSSVGQIISIPAGTSGYVLTAQGVGSNPIWSAVAGSSISITGDSGGALVGNAFIFTGGTTGLTFAGAVATETLTGTLNVAHGGTGDTTLTNHGVLLGQGTSAVVATAVGTTGQVLTGVTGLDPVWASPAASSISITGDSGGALVGNAFTFTGGTTGLTFAGAGSTETLGGTLVVSNGGTGATTLTGVLIGHGTSAVTGNAITNHNVLVGGASNAITSVAPSATSGVPFISQGAAADPIFGTAVVAGGGTGATTLTNHGVLLGQGTSAIVATAVGTTGQVLTGVTGADPVWASPASGSITINGDTGSVSGTTFTFTKTGSATNAGATVSFEAFSGSMVALNMSDTLANTLVGDNSGGTGPFMNGGNSGFGASSLGSLTTGPNNSAFGGAALDSLEDGGYNSAIGFQSANQLVSGNANVFVGYQAGSSYTTNESNNIIIGSSLFGVVGESDVIRIGETQTECYVAGIATVAVSNKNYVTIDTTTGQMGSDSGPSSSFAWSVITANQTAAVNHGYICNKAGTLALALPATSAVGDTIEVTNENTALGVQFTQASGQQILIGNTNTTSGATGTLTSSAVGDTLKIVCKTANTIWRVTSDIGNWTPA